MRIAVYSAVIAALLLFPQICAQSAREALTIWGLHIVPTLFPYMVVSKMLANQIRKTAFPPTIASMLLGVLGGSPSGASIIQSCSSRLTHKTILTLCAFTGTISPMFFLGILSNWTNDSALSAQLLFSHLSGAAVSALCVYLFSSRYSHSCNDPAHPLQSGSPLSESIDAILQVGGCVICFSVAAGLLHLLPLPKEIIPVLHALLEISGGAHALIEAPISLPFKKLFLAFTTGFSGGSILSQNSLFVKPLGIHPYTLFFFAITRGIFAALIMTILFL